MQYTEQELSKLIQDVEKEFTAHLVKSESSAAQPASLAKAEDEKPAKEESKDEAPAESKPEAKESKDEKPKDAPAEAAPEAKPDAEAAPAAPAEEAPVAPSADEGASGYDAEDIAHMDKMYMSMSKAELIAHHDSCVRALDASGAEHSHAAAPAAPPAEAAPAAPASEIDKCGDMSMGKSENTEVTSIEVKAEDIKTNPEVEILKSEVTAEKAKTAELKKNLDAVQEFLTQLVKKVPQGKAITAYEQVAKSESTEGEKQLSKGEIDSILNKKAADPSLTKSDREAINAFYLNGANFNTISHLLKN